MKILPFLTIPCLKVVLWASKFTALKPGLVCSSMFTCVPLTLNRPVSRHRLSSNGQLLQGDFNLAKQHWPMSVALASGQLYDADDVATPGDILGTHRNHNGALTGAIIDYMLATPDIVPSFRGQTRTLHPARNGVPSKILLMKTCQLVTPKWLGPC